MSVPRELGLHEMVRELTETHQHREHHTVEAESGTRWGLDHITFQPALILQLLGVSDSTSGSGAESGSVPSSRPTIRVESLDTVDLIDDEAVRWLERLGRSVPPGVWDATAMAWVRGSGTVARVRRLRALVPVVPTCNRLHLQRDRETGEACCLRHRLEVDIRRWWQQARIVSGWESPAFRPYSPCPTCSDRRGLRINIWMKTGLCVECWTIWSGHHWTALVEHIRKPNAPELDGGDA